MSKYNEKNTVNHPLAKKNKGCVKTINCLIERESFHKNQKRCEDYKENCFGTAQAINLDKIAKKQYPIPPSVDMAIGLDYDTFLLVELKLNVEKVPEKRLSKKLISKKTSSIELLNGANIKGCILIYCKKDRAKNYINRMKKEEKREEETPKHGYSMMFLKGLKNIYF